jgi:IclR family transcriptional regulator, KDG regulon repressor
MRQIKSQRIAMPRTLSPDAPYRIQVVDRATQILECFHFDAHELSVREISQRTGLHKSTAHRILIALQYNGLIQQNPETGNYHLGIKLFKLGQLAVMRLNLREIARPLLRVLMEETRETVHLAILDEEQVFYLEKVEGPYALRMPSRVGRHIPAYCTSLGKAMLSCLEEAEVRRMLGSHSLKAYTAHTLRTVDALITELRRTRRRGYAVDNEEIEIGLRCVGAPLRDYSGALAGAVSVAGPTARFTRDKISFFAGLAKKTAASISSQLGFGQVDLPDEKEARLGRA